MSSVKDQTNNSGQAREVPESKVEPTNLLLIGNLQRPYIHNSLKNLLNEHGNVTDLWINSKKTYAIATFSNNEGAQTARKNLYNVKWPENGKYITLDFIEESEKAQTLERGDYVPPVSENAMAEESKDNLANGDQKENVSSERKGLSKKELRDPRRRRGDRMEEEPITELTKIFRKTISKPSIFYLPNTKEKADKLLSLRRK